MTRCGITIDDWNDPDAEHFYGYAWFFEGPDESRASTHELTHILGPGEAHDFNRKDRSNTYHAGMESARFSREEVLFKQGLLYLTDRFGIVPIEIGAWSTSVNRFILPPERVQVLRSWPVLSHLRPVCREYWSHIANGR